MSETDSRADSPIVGVVRPADGVERRKVAAGTATEMQLLLGAEGEAPNFALRSCRNALPVGLPGPSVLSGWCSPR